MPSTSTQISHQSMHFIDPTTGGRNPRSKHAHAHAHAPPHNRHKAQKHPSPHPQFAVLRANAHATATTSRLNTKPIGIYALGPFLRCRPQVTRPWIRDQCRAGRQAPPPGRRTKRDNCICTWWPMPGVYFSDPESVLPSLSPVSPQTAKRAGVRPSTLTRTLVAICRFAPLTLVLHPAGSCLVRRTLGMLDWKPPLVQSRAVSHHPPARIPIAQCLAKARSCPQSDLAPACKQLVAGSGTSGRLAAGVPQLPPSAMDRGRCAPLWCADRLCPSV